MPTVATPSNTDITAALTAPATTPAKTAKEEEVCSHFGSRQIAVFALGTPPFAKIRGTQIAVRRLVWCCAPALLCIFGPRRYYSWCNCWQLPCGCCSAFTTAIGVLGFEFIRIQTASAARNSEFVCTRHFSTLWSEITLCSPAPRY